MLPDACLVFQYMYMCVFIHKYVYACNICLNNFNLAICLNGCYNGGVCRFPGLCTCSDGWSGNNCTTRM